MGNTLNFFGGIEMSYQNQYAKKVILNNDKEFQLHKSDMDINGVDYDGGEALDHDTKAVPKKYPCQVFSVIYEDDYVYHWFSYMKKGKACVSCGHKEMEWVDDYDQSEVYGD